MARVVIADAGPLIALAGIDRLEVFRSLFGRATLPEAIARECTAKAGSDTERIAAALADGWLVRRAPGPEMPEIPLTPNLGPGESEAIVLAMAEPKQRLLIMDDRLARRYALRRGLSVIGTVRLLDLAEARGLVESAAQCIEAMSANGYRISPELLAVVREGSEGER